MHVTAPLDAPVHCGVINEILCRFGDRWTLMVIIALADQPRRFNDLRRRVGDVSQQMLARTLKALERDGMVVRTVHATRPPQVEYALTGLGRSLSEAVLHVGRWARTNIAAIQDNRRRHDADPG